MALPSSGTKGSNLPADRGRWTSLVGDQTGDEGVAKCCRLFSWYYFGGSGWFCRGVLKGWELNEVKGKTLMKTARSLFSFGILELFILFCSPFFPFLGFCWWLWLSFSTLATSFWFHTHWSCVKNKLSPYSSMFATRKEISWETLPNSR